MGVLKRLALRRHLEWLAPHGQDEQSYTSAFQFQVLIPFTRFSLYEFLPSGCAGVTNQTSAKDIGLPRDALSTKLEVGRKQFPVRRAFRRRRFKKMPSKDDNNFYTDETTVTAERRGHLRFPFTASVEAIEPKSGTRINGRSTDLGLGGCYVDSLSPFAVGTVVKIRITKNDECFDAKAMVTFSQVGMGMGLSFVASEPQQSALFQRWVIESSGGGSEQVKEDREAPVSKSAGPHEALHAEQVDVLNALVIALMRKGLLAEREGREMLRKLHRGVSGPDKSTAGS
jgi:hypothetical protein